MSGLFNCIAGRSSRLPKMPRKGLPNSASDMQLSSRPQSDEQRRPVLERLLTAVILALLMVTVISGTSENIHAQMLKLGAYIWEDYFILRQAQPDASCELELNIQARVEQLRLEHEAENAEFDLISEPFDADAARQSLLGQIRVCQKKHDDAQTYREHNSVAVRWFSALEQRVADFSLFAIAHQRSTLITILMLAALVTSYRSGFIAFRAVRSVQEHRVSEGAQALANAALGISTLGFYHGANNAGTELANPELLLIIMLGCALLVLVNLLKLKHAPRNLDPSFKAVFRLLLCVPIHTWMLLLSAFHFFVNEQHLAGLAIYFTQIFQLTNLHLAIGLYILGGMLLKESHLGARLFDVFRPWRLPPELLAVVAIALMALPTAYTGASGIIIIAMGAVVYQEMRRVGTRRQLALAVTAMTGSGVVLRPCLLVVGIAILNKEVVTDELFYWGGYVFLLGLLVFAVFAWLTRREAPSLVPAREAMQPSALKLVALWPYIAIIAGFLGFYALVLDTYLDEFSAPIVLPVLVACLLIYERKLSRQFWRYNEQLSASTRLSTAFANAASHSSIQIGALLMLMACSFTIGGVLERGGAVLEVPELFASRFAAMAVLLLFLVFIGMLMDPFGALILVSGTIAPVAYAHGIHPVHFWMTCLMAFELGYVSPPVSLNHLLTRQVVGDKEVELALTEGDSFYYRHERLLLPLLVMSTTLVLVAFGPLLWLAYTGP